MSGIAHGFPENPLEVEECGCSDIGSDDDIKDVIVVLDSALREAREEGRREGVDQADRECKWAVGTIRDDQHAKTREACARLVECSTEIPDSKTPQEVAADIRALSREAVERG